MLLWVHKSFNVAVETDVESLSLIRVILSLGKLWFAKKSKKQRKKPLYNPNKNIGEYDLLILDWTDCSWSCTVEKNTWICVTCHFFVIMCEIYEQFQSDNCFQVNPFFFSAFLIAYEWLPNIKSLFTVWVQL